MQPPSHVRLPTCGRSYVQQWILQGRRRLPNAELWLMQPPPHARLPIMRRVTATVDTTRTATICTNALLSPGRQRRQPSSGSDSAFQLAPPLLRRGPLARLVQQTRTTLYSIPGRYRPCTDQNMWQPTACQLRFTCCSCHYADFDDGTATKDNGVCADKAWPGCR